MRAPGRLSAAAIGGFVLVCLLFSIQWRFMTQDARRSIIAGDGEGYFAYLDGLLIQSDLAHVEAKAHHFAPANGGRAIKYFCGTAILEAPFVVIGHIASILTNQPVDGRSLPYGISVAFSAIFYVLFGSYMIRSFLASYGLSDAVIAATIVILLFGTGLGYYVVDTPGMSHVYGFAMVAWTFHNARQSRCAPSPGRLAGTALSIGLIALVRPTDALCLIALPIVAIGTRQSMWEWFRRVGQRPFLLAGSILVMVLALQPLLWYAQCGRFFIRPYADEGFLWHRPMFWSVLFGARNGLFFFWPLLLLALPGAWLLFRRSRVAALALLAALIVLTYVIGCWWIWYYGYSYGPRSFIDLLPLFALPIALVFDAVPKARWTWMAVAIGPFLALQCFQLWQYHVGILHPYNMDSEKYRRAFLSTDMDLRGAFGGANRVPPYAPEGLELIVDGNDTTHWALGTAMYEQRTATNRIDAEHPSSVFTVSADELPDGRPLHVEVWLRRKAVDRGASDDALLVCEFGQGAQARYGEEWPLNDLPLPDDRTWRPWRYVFTMPPVQPSDELRCYVRMNGAGTVLIADLQARISAPR